MAEKWSPEQVQKLVRLYSNTSNASLAAMLGRTEPAIIYKAGQLGLRKSREHIRVVCAANNKKAGRFTGRRNGQANRKHFFNERYFETVDSPEKAYWLGFIHADGSLVFDSSRGRIMCLDLRIKKEDSRLIEQFVLDIGGDLAFVEEWGARRGVRLRSPVLAESLQSLGIRPKKSRLDDPALIRSGSLFPHYVRGYIDGDGSVNMCRGHLRVTIVGSERLCHDILEGTRRDAGIQGGNVYRCPHSSRYVVAFQTMDQCTALAKWMYRDATRYLERKRKRFGEQTSEG